MAYATAAMVRKVVEDVDPAFDLTPSIEYAHELVTEVCEDKGYTTLRKEKIETWLAAHFYAITIRDAVVSSERADVVGANYQYQVGLFLHGTKYGQQALLLDTKGGLAALSKQMERGNSNLIIPGMLYIGRERDENKQLK